MIQKKYQFNFSDFQIFHFIVIIRQIPLIPQLIASFTSTQIAIATLPSLMYNLTVLGWNFSIEYW